MDEEFKELLGREEPLCEELAAFLTRDELFDSLCHPLLYQVPYVDQMAALCNAMLVRRKEALEEAKAAGDWVRVVQLHEKAWRPWALVELRERIAPEPFAQLLRWVWTATENHREQTERWAELADVALFRRSMDPDESAALRALDEVLPIYRGTRQADLDEGYLGMSWTLDRAVAERFATRWARDGGPVVVAATVPRDAVLAYYGEADEAEVVVRAESVNVVSIEAVQGAGDGEGF